MKEDILDIEICENGLIKVTTPHISSANHKNADDFLAFIAREAGGAVTKTKNKHGHTHAHTHEHQKGQA